MTGFELIALLLAWGLAGGSPGPATLTIAGTAMGQGRRAGVLTGAGVWAGSALWGVAAMAGMGALMLANAWMAEALRYIGAGYLLFLAAKSLRSALTPGKSLAVRDAGATGHFRRGFLVHLTNPKAILAWGAVYAVVVPPGAPLITLLGTFAALSTVSAIIFLGYGILFSGRGVVRAYNAARRWFELTFAALFGAAAIKILTARLT
ncbi:LysE family translocator [Nioella aestuarii]|uniref:LysE family translocator n=1 Tax=Nioella aestuarii TaxID=1662864 RepID=UPI003D7FB931